jgi:hypothetical protein
MPRRQKLARRVIGGKPEDDGLMSYMSPQATRVQAPEPPGGFRSPRRPKALRSRRRQRAAEAEQLHLASIFSIGTVVIGAVAVFMVIMIAVLFVLEH